MRKKITDQLLREIEVEMTSDMTKVQTEAFIKRMAPKLNTTLATMRKAVRYLQQKQVSREVTWIQLWQ